MNCQTFSQILARKEKVSTTPPPSKKQNKKMKKKKKIMTSKVTTANLSEKCFQQFVQLRLNSTKQLTAVCQKNDNSVPTVV